MKTKIIRMSNSYSIRIPRPLLEKSGLIGEDEPEAKGDPDDKFWSAFFGYVIKG